MNDENDRVAYEVSIAMPNTLEGFTRHEMNRIAQGIVAKVDEGTTEEAQTYVKLDFLIKALETAKKVISESAKDELIKYDKQSCMGVGVTFGNRVTYDYSNSEEWVKLNARRKQIEENMKQAAKQDSQMTLDGEIVPPASIKSASESITLKYAKD
jgi:hypothetical protein